MFHIAASIEVATCGGAGFSAFYLGWLKARSRFCISVTPKPESAELVSLRSRHGYNEHSVIGSSIDSEVWISPDGCGAIPYTESAGVWMVAGEPIAADADLARITREFLRLAKQNRKAVAFLPTTERFARAIASDDLRIVKVGASPFFDLTKWDPRGNSAKHLRAGLNRARRAGVSVSQVAEVTCEFKDEVSALMDEWGESRRAGVRFGWLFQLMPFHNPELKRFFVARDADGQVQGMIAASAIPARNGWYLEDVIRATNAPQGTSDLLVYEAMRSLAASGAKVATLGTVPLSTKGGDAISSGRNRVVETMLDLSRRKLTSLYNFEGLGHFKSKFVPCWWENQYVVVTKGHLIPPRVANALFNIAIPGGILHVLIAAMSGDAS